MINFGVGADGFTLPLVVRACAIIGSHRLCKILRCHVLRMGFQNHLHVVNELLDVLADGIRREGAKPCDMDILVVESCPMNLVGGEALHGYVLRGGFGNYLFVKNSLICIYGKHGPVNDAEVLFSEMESKNIVTWNALITSYGESGLCDQAFALFSQLEKLDGHPLMRPNVISSCVVIGGFASKGQYEESLELFRQMEIHAHVIRGSMDSNVLVGNGLINMYAKCDSLRQGHWALKKINDKDLFSWNTMIAGCGMHGLSDNALETFDQMIEDGYKPNRVTFVAVISACSHAGLVNESCKLFDQMRGEYRIEPRVEHYACMVDLLGRAGFLQEASGTVGSLPIEPNACVWGALLNSCRMYKNEDIVEETDSHILILNCAMTGNYMLLSNINTVSERWGDSARIRLLARSKGLEKMPGQRWIEVKKKVPSCGFGLWKTMRYGCLLNMYYFIMVLKSCNKFLDVVDGKQIHGVVSCIFIVFLMDAAMQAKCLMKCSLEKLSSSWHGLISRYLSSGLFDEIISLFLKMDVKPN
ncbi:hypothetical protein LguiB_008427 [Lonicera macranthoides]